MTFQSTLPVWGATPVRKEIKRAGFISIHAPRVGSDLRYHSIRPRHDYFNPRSPCGERLCAFVAAVLAAHFNPRSPCGERPAVLFQIIQLLLFQSTLPVWGATRDWMKQSLFDMIFQSTLPVWGATAVSAAFWDAHGISIHAPRVGSDRSLIVMMASCFIFQSTLPVWGATLT